jgi:hypothetical protein
MELQRSAGNQAVGALLARDAEKQDAGDRGTSVTLVLPDPFGVLPVEAFTMAGEESITVTVPSSAVTPALFEAASNGKELATAKLSTSYLELEMKGVIISSIQVSAGGSTSFTVNAASITKDYPKKPEGVVGG